MMIIFISCVKQKRQERSLAEDLYTSDLFRKSLAYAKSLNPSRIFILSAKYGALDLNEIVEPYELCLNTMTEKQRKQWSYKVVQQLEEKSIDFNEETVFLCGKYYRRYLMLKFPHSTAPLKRLGIGRQLAFYKQQLLKQ